MYSVDVRRETRLLYKKSSVIPHELNRLTNFR